MREHRARPLSSEHHDPVRTTMEPLGDPVRAFRHRLCQASAQVESIVMQVLYLMLADSFRHPTGGVRNGMVGLN